MNLTVDDITFGYNAERNVLEHLSLRYDSPDVLCILGANGMGKSTLLQCIIGAFRISAGSITVASGEPSRSCVGSPTNVRTPERSAPE